MAKSETIIIRVDAESKRRIEAAAEDLGLTLTTFLLKAAEAAASGVEKRRERARVPFRPVGRKTSGACPSFFRAICLEASRGGELGYDRAGRKLVRVAAELIAGDTAEELAEKCKDLKGLVRDRADNCVLGWFDRELPRCMELIPRRRRPTFLAGVYQEIEEDGGVLTPLR